MLRIYKLFLTFIMLSTAITPNAGTRKGEAFQKAAVIFKRGKRGHLI